MRFSKEAVTKSADATNRDEIRELAEAISLWRSAMHHVAERPLERRKVVELRMAGGFRMRLLLAPALAAAVAAGVLIPIYSHPHHAATAAASSEASGTQTGEERGNPQRASIDDTALMNQIDSQLSEEVPDALQPLTGWNETTMGKNKVSEKTNVTQK